MCEIEKLFDTFGVDAWHHPSMVSIDGVRHRIIMQDSRPSALGVHLGSGASLLGNDPRSVHAGMIKLAREFRRLTAAECDFLVPGMEYTKKLSGKFSAALALLSEMVAAVLLESRPDGSMPNGRVTVIDAHVEGTYGNGHILRLECIVAAEDSPPFELYTGIQINPMWQHQIPRVDIHPRTNRTHHSCVLLSDLVTKRKDIKRFGYPALYSTEPMLAMSIGNTFDEACFGLDVMVSKAVTKAMLATT